MTKKKKYQKLLQLFFGCKGESTDIRTNQQHKVAINEQMNSMYYNIMTDRTEKHHLKIIFQKRIAFNMKTN